MPLDTQTINNLTMGVIALGAAFLAALWLSLIIWTYRDARSRARDPFLRVLASIMVGLLFLPGILIYLILRPAHTLEEEYHRTLEEEALLQTIEDAPVCPGCGRRIQNDWMVCPSCHTKLKKPCQQCHRLMELPWNLCPYCGTPSPGRRRESTSVNELSEPISGEESASARDPGSLKQAAAQEDTLK